MTAFEFLSVALSFVLGLAVTLLLTSLLSAFRARRECRMDWLPFVWAGYVLAYQFQFWWAIFELSTVPQWTIGTFGVLLLLAVILFLAGGLTLPSGSAKYPQDLRDYFKEDGKWGVIAVAAYGSASPAANVILFGSPLFSLLHATAALGVVSALAVATAKSRFTQTLMTVLFGASLVIGFVMATPGVY